VKWSTFWNYFSELFPTSVITSENVECLYRLLELHKVTAEHEKKLVTLEQFGNVLAWFGPLLPPDRSSNQLTLLEKVCEIF
jgi:hypothetical protein